MKKLLFAAALFLLSPFIVLAESSPKGIEIGVSLVLSGAWAPWGEANKNGLILAAKDSKNGLRFQFQDDQCEPRAAVSAFSKLLLIDKLPLIVLACMENIPATLPLAEKAGAFVFSIGSMQTQFLKRFPNLLSMYSLADAEVYYLLPYAHDVDQVKTMSIISHAAAIGESMANAAETLAPQAGITIVRKEILALDETDPQTVLPRIIRANPDALFVHLGPRAVGSFVKKARELGYQGKIYSTFTFESEETVLSGGAKIEGVRYTYQVTTPEDQQKLLAFTERYTKEFSRAPDNTAALAYDTGILLDQALTKCAPQDHSCLTSFFATLGEYNGLGGKVFFRKDRSALRPFGLKEYKNGAFTWIEKELKPLDLP